MNTLKTLLVTLGFGAVVLGAGSPSVRAEEAPPRVVEIVAKRFEYSPKELTLKKGEPVILRLRTEDVTHGFFSRPLKLEADIEPGKATDLSLTPDKAGTYLVICDHFCGAGHGAMKMKIVVE